MKLIDDPYVGAVIFFLLAILSIVFINRDLIFKKK